MNDPLSQLDLPYVCRTPGDQEMVDIALANGLSPRAAEAVAAIDAVMHKVRRSIQRRDFGRRVLAKLDGDLDVAHLDTISAIAHNPVWSDVAKDEEVTVGLIAERLGIDPSRASRLSADVVERGYARRVASQADARRICLELTEKGERFVAAVRRNKWELFAGALGQWSEQELVVFAALLDRFSGWATDNDGIERSAENIKHMLADAK
jgi:DNA-binding MarR family transcriptional regulator